jgi:O-antigen/teichoic acid export membrane protein
MQIKSSIATQGILALVTLAQNLVLIRFAEPNQYGFFVLVSAAALTLAMMQNALIGSQMSVLLPALKSAFAQDRYRNAFALANAALLALGVLAGMVVSSVAGFSAPLELVGAGGFVAAWLAREFVRIKDFSLFTGGSALKREAAIAGATFIASAGLWKVTTPANAMLLGAMLGTFVVVPALKGLFPRWSRRSYISLKVVYRRHRSNTIWAFVGAFLSECQQRAYVYVTQALLGLQALASVQAGRLPFGPLNILFGGFGRAARPVYAKLISDNNHSGALTLLGRHLAVLLLLNAAAALGLFLLWPWIDMLIFKARYPDVERYVVAWGLMLVVFQLRSTISLYFQGLRSFQTLAKINGWATGICLMVLALMWITPDPLIAIGSIIAAEITSLLFMTLLLLKSHRIFLSHHKGA